MMFQNNLKIALRSLLRRRTFTVINTIGLMLGMTAAIFAFLWVQNEVSFDNYHENAANIYRINTDLKVGNGDTWEWAISPLSLAETISRDLPEVKQTASLYENHYQPFTLRKDEKLLRGKSYTYVSENWFDMFDLPKTTHQISHRGYEIWHLVSSYEVI